MSVQLNITITDEENKVIEFYMGVGGAETWARDAIKNKCINRAHAIIKQFTNYNPDKLSLVEIKNIIAGLTLPPGEGRN